MKPITKEQYQFIENNFVSSVEYNLDFDSINQMLLFKNKIKKIGFVIDNSFFGLLCLFFGFSSIIVVSMFIADFINETLKKINYEIDSGFLVWIAIFIGYLYLGLLSTILDKFTLGTTARNFALLLLSFISQSKCKYYKKNEILFDDYVNKLKLKVSNKIENQNNLINGLRWLYDKSISYMRETQMSIKNFENEFNNIKEINTAFQLGLSDAEKSTFDSKNKNSDWWKMEEKIQQTKSRLEEEIIKREKDEIIRREKEIESEKIKNEKRIIAPAEYEKKRQEENRIYEENRQQRLNEAEVKRREREIILRIEQEKRKQQKEEEKFQKFLKKQIEKTNNVLKPKSKINNPRINVNKVITPDKLKQIIDQKITIGALGEQIIFEELKLRLIGTIYQPLIEKFKHVSIEQGDGLGYDILAYNETGEKIYVEVKTTTAKYPSASFSKNEIAFATQFDENYVLFLVYNLNSDNFGYEEFVGYSDIKEKLNFQPISYKLKIKNNLSNQDNQLNQ